ncbi:MAG: TraB/GumN family protein [Thermomonas sp.]|uniref:TraB/GumN family protein n=1 Tax=Thermomonas sp. TaxID=1971895 RepID=UPI0039E4D7E8
MRNAMLAATMLAMFTFPALAQETTVQPQPQAATQQAMPEDGIRTVETVVVDGEQPGPGLWLVRNGQHDLYILGTLRPLPANMQWQSAQVERVLAGAQEVIRMRLQISADVGYLKGLLLLPRMLGARKNPDGKSLQEVVSPQSYARWQVLKARYIGNDRGVEKWRPLFAAQELYKAAMKKSGLDNAKSVGPVIAKAIEAHHPAVTVVEEVILIKDPKSVLKEWSKTTVDDLACFDNAMRVIESDLDIMRARANAWATGDMAALQALPTAAQAEVCINAISETAIGKRLGYGNAQRNLKAKWLAAAEAALANNTVTFATLDISDMLGANGYLAALKAKGYTVIAPDE